MYLFSRPPRGVASRGSDPATPGSDPGIDPGILLLLPAPPGRRRPLTARRISTSLADWYRRRSPALLQATSSRPAMPQCVLTAETRACHAIPEPSAVGRRRKWDVASRPEAAACAVMCPVVRGGERDFACDVGHYVIDPRKGR